MNDMIDVIQLRKALNVLKPNHDLFELRILLKPKKTISGYFKDVEVAIDELSKQNLKNANVFFTLNDVKPDCYDRIQHDKMRVPENTTSDEDIAGYRWLLVDLDPVRITGISSTDAQISLAKAKAQKIFMFLKNQGFEDPVIGMSGNGFHLLYRVQLSVDRRGIVENFLKALDLMFSDDQVAVDTANFNPSRICKMYGTLAQKGAGTDDRPHRMSYLVSVPKDIKDTDITYVRKVAEMLPKQEAPQPYNNYNPRQFDVVDWMNAHGIRYKEKSGNEYKKYILESCPFNSNHKSPDSMISVGRSGAIGFKCLHNSCQGKTWKDVRLMFEPDAYDHDDDEERINAGWRQHKLHNRNKPIVYEDFEEEVPEEPIFLTAKQILEMPKETEDFILSGIEGIDNRMRGLKKGSVSVLSGLRGGSKSTLLTEIALSAVDDGHNVICYSGELTSKNFMTWMNLQAAGKVYTRSHPTWQNYYYVPDDIQVKIADWLGDHFLLYNNDYGNDFKKLYQRLKDQIAKQKTDLLILDNLMALDIHELDRDQWLQQKVFIQLLCQLAKKTLVHIIFVAHPRKVNGFLRLQDVSGTNDLVNMVDNAFIIHRNNEDFRKASAEMFKWKEDNPIYEATNIIEIAKDRDTGYQDVFIPLWYEPESKRLKNSKAEMCVYGWVEEEQESFDDIKF